EGLEPERIRHAPQEFVAAVFVHDRLRHHCAERGHARGEPWRHAAAMQGKIGAAGTPAHAGLAGRTRKARLMRGPTACFDLGMPWSCVDCIAWLIASRLP